MLDKIASAERQFRIPPESIMQPAKFISSKDLPGPLGECGDLDDGQADDDQ